MEWLEVIQMLATWMAWLAVLLAGAFLAVSVI